jgi:hypothetical protein
MFFSSWLRKHPATPRTSRRATSTFRPRLEVLEGRDVPSTLKVTNNLDNLAPGSLRYEIAAAQSGDTIVFDQSLKRQTITLAGELHITRSLTIKGLGAYQLWISSLCYPSGLSCLPGSRLFEVDANTSVTLSGLGLINGGGTALIGRSDQPYDGYGGAILNFGALTLSGVTVGGNDSNGASAGNYASQFGGGIANFGTLMLTNSTVSNNSLSLNGNVANQYGVGGGIYNAGTLTVSGSTLSHNAALYGAAIYNAGTATVEKNSTLSANNAGAEGGGIYNAGSLTVSNSFFTSNTPDNIYGTYTDGGGNTFK